MSDWEFLIQKEGDRSWLPLDAPNVEILEGRYRIVAQANRANTPVSIRVSHLATQEMPPKRRIQKRSSHTNQTGLVAVIPFTQLQAGIWELQCASADLMSDLLGDHWQYAVRLQVQPQQSEDDWETEWPIDQSESAETDQLAAPESETTRQPAPVSHIHPSWMRVVTDPAALQASVERLLKMAEPGSNAGLIPEEVTDQHAVEEITLINGSETRSEPDLALTTNSETANGEVTPPQSGSVAASEWVESNFRDLTIRLEQPSIVANHGQAVMVAGWVEVQVTEQNDLTRPTNLEDQAHAGSTLIPKEIQLWLRDPQTLDVVSHDRQPLPSLVPPFLFTFSLTLPNRLTTHLLLGEVSICGPSTDSKNDLTAINTQNFSITVNPAEWMSDSTPVAEEPVVQAEESVNEPFETTESAEPEISIQLPSLDAPLPAPADTPVNLELSFLLSPEEAEKRSSGLSKVLPPQIYQSTAETTAPRSLELPQFITAKPADLPPDQLTADSDLQASDHEVTPLTEEEQHSSVTEDALEQADETVTMADVYSSPAVDSVSIPDPKTAQDIPPIHEAVSVPMLSDKQEVPLVEQESQSVSPISELAETQAPVLTSASEIEDASPLEQNLSNHPSPEEAESEDPYLVAANRAFRALNLHDRFLSRLTSLATDVELATWLKASDPSQPVEQAISTPMPAPQPDFLAYEIVVDDQTEVAPRRAGWMPPAQPEVISTQASIPTLPVDQRLDRTIPVPELNLVSGELVSGEAVQLRVRLPEAEVGYYAKVWITDCETRELLDGPHWLVDFIPNGFDGQDAYVQLTVPFGSTAIQFEAIAFEIHSQCESRKAIAMRPVVPPDLPVVTFDEFSDRL